MEAIQGGYRRPAFFRSLSGFDWVYAAALAAGSAYAYSRYGGYMDAYEKGILFLTAASFIGLGWFWKPMRVLLPAVAALSLFGISQYHGELARAGQSFLLKYLFASQSAIMWMSALFVMATGGLLARPAGALRFRQPRFRRHHLERRRDGADRPDGALVRVLPDRRRCRPYPAQQPV